MRLPILQVAIQQEYAIILVQQRTRRLAALAGLSTLEQARFATAALEIARNALQYAGGGQAAFSVIERNNRQYLQLVVYDEGPGIPHLSEVLSGTYQSETGPGQGICGARMLVDLFRIDAEPGKGTVVVLAKALPLNRQRITEQIAMEWAKTFSREVPPSPLEELQRRNQELAQALEELHEYRERLEQIVDERIRELRENRELQAYTQGRLDVLDTIVHNIGNTIHAVTAGIRTIADDVKDNRLTRYFYDCVEAIKAHEDNLADYIENDPQGKMVAPFLVALAENFKKHEVEMAERIRRVAESAEHIASIVRSQKALGRQGVYRKAVNVEKAIEQALTLVLQDSEKQYITVQMDCSEAPREIYTQESRFQQMLINLIKNAVEAVDERFLADEDWEEPPTIQIRCETESEFLVLSIMDNGVGIEQEQLPLIFGPRYTTKPLGAGLGLHSVANFVGESGGQIEARSDGKNCGAELCITLPIGKPAR
jgi:signal transduction histidine kinase